MHNERSFARRALARVYGSVYGNTVNSYLLPKCVLGRSRLRASSPAEHTTFYRGSYSNAHEHTSHYTVHTPVHTHTTHKDKAFITQAIPPRAAAPPRRAAPAAAAPRARPEDSTLHTPATHYFSPDRGAVSHPG